MLVLLSLALSAAVADDQAKPAKPKKERLICRQLDQTGTRMGPPPVCKTAAQWEAEAELTRKTMQFRERKNGM